MHFKGGWQPRAPFRCNVLTQGAVKLSGVMLCGHCVSSSELSDCSPGPDVKLPRFSHRTKERGVWDMCSKDAYASARRVCDVHAAIGATA
eukprot:6479962-Amphidinium_carterae.1